MHGNVIILVVSITVLGDSVVSMCQAEKDPQNFIHMFGITSSEKTVLNRGTYIRGCAVHHEISLSIYLTDHFSFVAVTP